MKSVVNNQRGGIVAFMVVGVVLALLLAGGIYASKNQGRNAALNPTAATPATETPKKPAEQQTTPKETPKDTTPAATPSTPQASTPTTPQTATPGSGSGSTPSQQQNIASTGPSTIASTGPSDVWVSTLALGAVMGGIVAYRRSILQMRSAALK